MKGKFVEAYSSFAQVYDRYMIDVPYETWSKNIINILKKQGIDEGIVADLGCGTGNITGLMAKAGYDMIGIDNSYDMLNIARDKFLDKNILFLCQDMREFELYGTCKAIISSCDSINYILEYEDLVKVFKLVNNYLDPKGLFIFDCNTLYKYENILASNTFAENSELGSFIWENEFDKKTNLNEYDLSLYIKSDENNLYERFEERHIQKAYTLDEIKLAAKTAGLIFKEVLDADNMQEISDKTERYLITMCENGKE